MRAALADAGVARELEVKSPAGLAFEVAVGSSGAPPPAPPATCLHRRPPPPPPHASPGRISSLMPHTHLMRAATVTAH